MSAGRFVGAVCATLAGATVLLLRAPAEPALAHGLVGRADLPVPAEPFALVLGHDRALALYRASSGASRSQLVMLVLMVCFTVLGLAALAGQCGMIVFAHAGHWLLQAAYLAPLALLVAILVVNQLRKRRERREDPPD